MQIANWLRPADTLGAIQSGSQAGLQLRAAIERERAARAEEAMRAQQMAQAEQIANDRIQQDYWQGMLQKGLKERELVDSREGREAARALTKSNYDSLAADRIADNRTAAQRLADAESKDRLGQEHTMGLAQDIAGGADLIKSLSKFPYADRGLTGNLMKDLMANRREDAATKKSETAADKVSTSYKIPKVDAVDARPARDWVGSWFDRPARAAIPGHDEITVHEKMDRNEIEKLKTPPTETPEYKSREKAKEAIQKNPAARIAILERLSKAGYSTEGL